MPCPSLVPKDGTTYAKCMSNKLTSYVVAYMNMIICVLAVMTLVFQPSTMSPMFEKMSKTEITVGVLLILTNFIFAMTLLLGLHQDRRLFIKSFLIFCGVYIVWATLGTIIILFTKPSMLGFRGFFLNAFTILMYIGFFCVIRCYQVATYP